MNIVDKYNLQIPRYTSYPTVPYWENNLTEDLWAERVKRSFATHNKEGISLYIHLPYCESLCTYCACNTRITVNHQVETPYINALLKEWQLYLSLFNEKPVVKEIHLGGGTPTFFSPENLERLISSLLKECEIAPHFDFSFEGHPSNTSLAHLISLYKLGFKRVSIGIQDFDESVQQAINRHQTLEEVKNVVEAARKVGYTSVNFDLVYGLPFQTEASVNETIKAALELKPDRIAFYSYAHVPWLKPGQRKYTDKDLPTGQQKKKLYEIGKNLFSTNRYTDIGLDHFALPGDELFTAFKAQKLHRNFMGYTTNTTKLLIGIGCSSISDSWNAYAQNIKDVETYIETVSKNKFPVLKGHLLTKEDQELRQHILNIMCLGQTNADNYYYAQEEKFKELEKDGLLLKENQHILVTPAGKPFLRNIALLFDKRYWASMPTSTLFSSAV